MVLQCAARTSQSGPHDVLRQTPCCKYNSTDVCNLNAKCVGLCSVDSQPFVPSSLPGSITQHGSKLAELYACLNICMCAFTGYFCRRTT
jgi:hypothetical protein